MDFHLRFLSTLFLILVKGMERLKSRWVASHSKSRPERVNQGFPTQWAVREDGRAYKRLPNPWRKVRLVWDVTANCQYPPLHFLTDVVSTILLGGAQIFHQDYWS